MKIALILLILVLFTSCNEQKENSIETNTINTLDMDSLEDTSKFDLTDTIYFNTVKNYIRSVGTIRKANASSLGTQELIVTYYDVYIDSMLISVDNTDRIYMSLNNKHFGNIIKANNTVTPEINYGISNTNSQLTKEKESKIIGLYKKLIIHYLNN